MPSRTLALVAFAAVASALPYAFVLDTRAVDAPPPFPPPNSTTDALSTNTILHSPPLARAPANNAPTSPTTTVTLTPTPVHLTPPPTTPQRSDPDPHTRSEAAPFTTTAAAPASKWPPWFTAASFTLVFYDIIACAVLVWLGVYGYLGWMRGGREDRRREMEMVREDGGDWARRRRREAEVEAEMRRLGMI